MQTKPLTPLDSIAVIGLGCRFPGGINSPADYWQLLKQGESAISSQDRFKHPELSPRGGFLDQIDQFDPTFFNISPREANFIDPQHRLLLEVSWEALEHAGLNPTDLKGSDTGVFVGIYAQDYQQLLKQHYEPTLYINTGNAFAVASGRVAHFFDFRGPTFSVDTASSASLVAVHLACQSLWTGEADLALAGGVNVMLSPDLSLAFQKAGMLAKDSRCKSFDAAADGYVRGEGCGVAVLKRLADAVADGDNILAVVRSSAINQDGASNGLTAPNQEAQEAVIRLALQRACLSPDEVDYVEAHGSGTPVGDPIEGQALQATYAATLRPHPLLIGSVKTNLGHLESAAGIAGFMKAVLAIQHGLIPAHLNFERLNPKLAAWSIKIPLKTQPFPPHESRPRRAGVSSFGFGGTNVHLILEQAPSKTKQNAIHKTTPPTLPPALDAVTPYLTPNLLTLSARTEPALRHLAQLYAHYLASTEAALVDICYTANLCRAHFDYRLSVVAENSRDMQAELLGYATRQATGSLVTGLVEPDKLPKIAFLFTGQGSQYLRMGQQLYETESNFRQTITHCAELLRAEGQFGRDLIELLYPQTDPEDNDLLENHTCGQVVNFVIECALATMWQSWGVKPDVVLGHSLGDFAAAYCAGVFSLEDGLRLVTLRGHLMQKAEGAMVLVTASEADVAPFIREYNDVVIGVINGPQNVVISGGHDNITQATHRLNDAGFRTRVLQIPIAAHSPMLDPVLADFEAAFSQIKLNEPHIRVVSSMSGQIVSHELTQPNYWRKHLRNPIRFAEAMQTVAAQGVTIFIELGPKPTLLGMGQQIWVDGKPQTVDASTSDSLPSTPLWLPSLQPPFTDWQTLSHCLSQLFVHGASFDWTAMEGDWIAIRQRVVLPTYPFQRQSYWADETFVTPVKINRAVPVNRLSPAATIAPPPDPLTLSLREQLATSLVTERSGMVTRFLQDQVRHILRLNSSQVIPLSRPLKELGLDSLMSGEFVAILDKTLQVKLPVQRLMGGGTLDNVAQMVLEKLNLTEVDSRRQTVDTTVGSKRQTVNASTSYNLPSTVDTTDFHTAAADIPQIHAVVTEQHNRKLKVGDKWVFDFASCNYLGLDLHPEVMAAVLPAIQKWGVHPSWTRAVASPAIYEELEQALADLMGCYSTLVFPAVTLLHSGVISVLAGYDGVIFKDISAHKSIDEACRLAQTSGAEIVVFKHNDAVDLERRLAQYPLQRTKIIAIDGVYSMSGAYADLPAFAHLAKMYHAWVYLDDAHGMGVIGEKPTVAMPYGFKGNGLVKHYDLDYAADRMIYVAGLSKSYSSFGAFITCTDEAMKNKFRSASTFIFSGPSPVASLASAIAGIRLNARDGEVWRKQVYDLTYRLVTEAKRMGFEVVNDNYFPIVGIVIGPTRQVITACKLLWEGEYGVLITPAIFPIVPLDKGLLRFSITASNTMEEIDYSLAALKAVRARLR